MARTERRWPLPPRPQPMFMGLVKAAMEYAEQGTKKPQPQVV